MRTCVDAIISHKLAGGATATDGAAAPDFPESANHWHHLAEWARPLLDQGHVINMNQPGTAALIMASVVRQVLAPLDAKVGRTVAPGTLAGKQLCNYTCTVLPQVARVVGQWKRSMATTVATAVARMHREVPGLNDAAVSLVAVFDKEWAELLRYSRTFVDTVVSGDDGTYAQIRWLRQVLEDAVSDRAAAARGGVNVDSGWLLGGLGFDHSVLTTVLNTINRVLGDFQVQVDKLKLYCHLLSWLSDQSVTKAANMLNNYAGALDSYTESNLSELQMQVQSLYWELEPYEGAHGELGFLL